MEKIKFIWNKEKNNCFCGLTLICVGILYLLHWIGYSLAIIYGANIEDGSEIFEVIFLALFITLVNFVVYFIAFVCCVGVITHYSDLNSEFKISKRENGHVDPYNNMKCEEPNSDNE